MGMMTVPMSLQEPDFMIHGRLKDGDVRSGVVDYHNDRRFLDHYGHTSADRMDRQQEVKEGKCHGYAWHISVCAGDGDGSPAEHGRRHFRR